MPKIKATLPKNTETNGLYELARRAAADPTKLHMAIVVCDCSKIEVDTDTGARDATVRIRRIEEVAPGDLRSAEYLLSHGIEWRLGDSLLPFDIDKEMGGIERSPPLTCVNERMFEVRAFPVRHGWSGSVAGRIGERKLKVSGSPTVTTRVVGRDQA